MPSESDLDEAKGRVKQATGNLTGNEELEREGARDRAKASAKDKVEKAKDAATDMIDKAAGDQ